jgi:hypothetical protein
MNKVTELNDRMREVIKARADAAFSDLAKEEAKHDTNNQAVATPPPAAAAPAP